MFWLINEWCNLIRAEGNLRNWWCLHLCPVRAEYWAKKQYLTSFIKVSGSGTQWVISIRCEGCGHVPFLPAAWKPKKGLRVGAPGRNWHIGIYLWLLASATTGAKFGSHHYCSYDRKNLYKLKIDGFSWTFRELSLEGKLPPWNLKRWGHPETQPRSAKSAKNRRCWNYEMVGTLKW